MIIYETYLDTFGHMNNAMYLTLFEQARWDLITSNDYGIKKIQETGLGPIILQIDIRFLKELRIRDEVIIETRFISYKKKIGKMIQKMMRGKEECTTAEITFGLFDMQERKLVLPTPEWLRAIGQ